MRLGRTATIAAAIVCAHVHVHAQASTDLTGVVVGVDGDDLILDIGATKGAKADDTIELWRTVQMRHPVTGQMISDRFLVGRLKASQVRPSLTLAAADEKLTRSPKVGDVVIFHHAQQQAAPQQIIVENTPPPDPDTGELAALFDALKGTAAVFRAQKYSEFAKAHPKSRFASALTEEAKAIVDAVQQQRAAPTSQPEAPHNPVVSFSAPEKAYADTPLHIGVELCRGAKGAVLYVATKDKTTYETFPMSPVSPGYFDAVIPAHDVKASLKIFVEAVDEQGRTHPSDDTHAIDVIERPDVTLAPPVLAQFGVWTDFATYNTKAFNDWTFQTEGYFGARFRDTGFRAVRSGFGVYRGVGGSLHELDDLGLQGRNVGLTYGWLEAEVAFSHIVSLVGRGVVGLDSDGIEGGMQALIRFGNDLSTNLLLGVDVLGGVGIRGIAQLEWSASPRVPIMFRSEVTNQPAGSAHSEVSSVSGSQGDVGVRLIAQAGYRFTSQLTLSLRASYQGRTINHAGPGGGAAVSYQW
jgi:hypothetical protein